MTETKRMRGQSRWFFASASRKMIGGTLALSSWGRNWRRRLAFGMTLTSPNTTRWRALRSSRVYF